VTSHTEVCAFDVAGGNGMAEAVVRVWLASCSGAGVRGPFRGRRLSALRPSSLLIVVLPLLGVGCVTFDRWPADEVGPPAPGLTPAGALSGRVVDAVGGTVAGAFVTVDPSGTQAVTDADGSWSVSRLLPGTYAVVVAAPGFSPGRTDSVQVVARRSSVADLTLERSVPDPLDGVLHVAVVGPDGLPAAGASLVARGPGVAATATTDQHGQASLVGLAGASVELTIDVPGRPVVVRSVDVDVPTEGSTELAVSLAGRGEPTDRFVRSQVCSFCHADVASTWRQTAHAQSMGAVEGSLATAFDDGLVVALGAAQAEFGRAVDGTAQIVLEDASGARDTWSIAGVIGGSRRGAVPWAERDGSGWPLPVVWVAPDPRYPGLFDGGWMPGERGPWLLDDGTFAYVGTPSSASSAEAACFACHVTGTRLTVDPDGSVSMQGVSSPSVRWDEGAVGCEACHGAGQTHTSGPLTEKLGSITVPDDLGADRHNDVCGRCHAAVEGDHGLPFAWTDGRGLLRPGDALADHVGSSFVAWPSGSAAVPNAQLDEVRASGHGLDGWNATCSDCHDPHGSGLQADLRLPVDDNSLCLTCHLGLSFEQDPADVELHGGHPDAVPELLPQSGRCVGCHQPETAARSVWSPLTGAGDLSSHAMVAVPPSDSIAAFDALSATVLPPGSFPPNACQACHVWNEVLTAGAFPGVAGDPLLRATHVEHQAEFEVLYP
jgi:predicted CXXCH cytochrome family protein